LAAPAVYHPRACRDIDLIAEKGRSINVVNEFFLGSHNNREIDDLPAAPEKRALYFKSSRNNASLDRIHGHGRNFYSRTR
jgi:hypothetical protein